MPVTNVEVTSASWLGRGGRAAGGGGVWGGGRGIRKMGQGRSVILRGMHTLFT